MVTAVASRLAKQREQRKAMLGALVLSEEQLLEVKRRMRVEMERGLARDRHAAASVKMLPTYVCSTPNGTGPSPTFHSMPRDWRAGEFGDSV
eukprot:g21943.t1